jgi:hypothetical protein
MSTVPLPLGAVAVIEVEESYVAEAALAPKNTVLVGTKFDPVIVTVLVVTPCDGETAETEGNRAVVRAIMGSVPKSSE